MPRKVRTKISRSKPRHSRKRISKQRRSSKLRKSIKKSRAHTRVKRRTNTYRRNLQKGGILPKIKRQPVIDLEVHDINIEDLNKGNINLPDVKYHFVILNEDPSRVKLFIPPSGGYGHTSLKILNNYEKELKEFLETNRKTNDSKDEVKYSGEIFIKNNKLDSWNNISGHYLPEGSQAETTGIDMGKFRGLSVMSWAALVKKPLKGGAGFSSFGYGYTDEQQQLGMSIMAGLLGAGYTAWKAWGLARTEMQRRAEQQRVEETAAQGMAMARATAEHNSKASRLFGWKQRLDGTYGPPTAANPYI